MSNKQSMYTPVESLDGNDDSREDENRRRVIGWRCACRRRRRLVVISVGLLLITLLFLSMFPARNHSNTNNTPLLSLNPNKKSFKILQLTDLHLGERPETDWGPQQDVKTYRALTSILLHETNTSTIDLIVLSGDVLSAQDVDANATVYYAQLAEFLESYQIPHALLFGNHDDADYEEWNPKNTSELINKRPAKTSRQQLARTMMQYPHSLTQLGPPTVFGTSNYALPIYCQGGSRTSSDELAAQVVLLDTGGGSLPNQLTQSQVDWFLQETSSNNKKIPTVVFQHIPLPQFLYNRTLCRVGLNGDGGIDPVVMDEGMYDAYSNNNVHFVAVGHNHGNDYICTSSADKLHLIFGRHSGYGGYTGGGGWTNRGARVYELLYSGSSSEIVGWKTYVRTEDGDVIDAYETTV